MPPNSPLARLRTLCLALADTTEVPSHGEPTFRVKGKMFAMFASGANHHGKGRDGVWCKATLPIQALMVEQHPDRIFVPPYVGHTGWLGVWLDGRVDWQMVRDLLEGAHRLAIPKRRRRSV